ncbi:hypothetical protein [Endozoicomonas sp. SCSIO W0465]|uniref:hypothetical protein n=1 Tax=Endozoicomonas sp. SCSIO W0465 TaxID=2918516 RepID=UPI0020765A0E|nr:hypothetical protein [Endozoicomonas sp. SCSIO W0465]USE35436.1 hypothetical protein MJO57_25595 [Endozoicomonas sp. SCSIO W0465]
MISQGIVPKWQTICNAEGQLPGIQLMIDNPEGADVFFSAMQQRLDRLEPGNPFFLTFVCSRTNPLTGQPEQVSPVMRVFRHPSDGSLILLFTSEVPTNNSSLGRLAFGSFEGGTELTTYLKFLALSSDATQGVFVEPTRRGGTPAKALESIDMRAFIEQYPPRDFSGGEATSDRKILLAAAQSLGLQRIRKEEAKNVELL